ncbi:peptidase M61 [Mesonia sp. HuA40]|uniref:M61 family metallopeptidase n=1 Tax=Mesonia sp. HuA40 TaxID=2602761 RepID=UPI0011C79A45|nr:peptidase M61 [Mesonia sp. HuA40]TXK74309.1 peptidase M61 [Mesonia sp. HuA40]
MKNIIFLLSLSFFIWSCGVQKNTKDQPFFTEVHIDLVNVENDRVEVKIDPQAFNQNSVSYHIPQTVPGTYSVDNYGRLLSGFKAYDYKGNLLPVKPIGMNSYEIQNARQLDYIAYTVDDTYDAEDELGVFSPSGTNIADDENFVLNLHGFVGYFTDLKETPYTISILRDAHLNGGTSLKKLSSQVVGEMQMKDIYQASRYFEVMDNPIMYTDVSAAEFNLEGGMQVRLYVYSPNKKYDAQDLRPNLEKILKAQKNFLGEIDNTGEYVILLYLSDLEKTVAQGFGALEHHTSTMVVMPEAIPLDFLNKSMTDVVAHEFFHIITPLNIHSKEVHYFDYAKPKMSQHLWMYEGVTEYFANLFQIDQKLINEPTFYQRIADKIDAAANYDDQVAFTHMSKHILEEPHASNYYNVYLKGALIGMSLDIRLRELSDGKMGVLHLMKSLSDKYGKNKPFDDDNLFQVITELTYPEIGDFLTTYVAGNTAIPYKKFLAKVGVEQSVDTIKTDFFLNQADPFIDAKPDSKEIFVREGIALNSFLKNAGLQGGDIIKSINRQNFNLDNIMNLILTSRNWKEGDKIEMQVERDGALLNLKTKVITPVLIKKELKNMDLPLEDPRVELRNAWLYGQ